MKINRPQSCQEDLLAFLTGVGQARFQNDELELPGRVTDV